MTPTTTPKGLVASRVVGECGGGDCGGNFCDCDCDCTYCPCIATDCTDGMMTTPDPTLLTNKGVTFKRERARD